MVEKNKPEGDTREIAYSSSNGAIATVEATAGIVTFKTAGTVIITTSKAATIARDYKKSEDTYTLYITMKPSNKAALVTEIQRAMREHGNNVDLNYIDTSAITNMMYFFSTDRIIGYGLSEFAGDISKWDVSSVTNMNVMFYRATAFNSDISSWQVQNVESMGDMFWYYSV